MTTQSPGPATPSWLTQLWAKTQPILIRESIVILDSVVRGGQRLQAQLETRAGQLNLPSPSPESSFLLKTQPFFQALAARWWQLMTWLRGKLPGAWQQKLSETGLTAIFIGLVLIFLWPSSSPTPVKQPRPITSPTPDTTVLVKPRPAPPVESVPIAALPEPETSLETPPLNPVAAPVDGQPPAELNPEPPLTIEPETNPAESVVEMPPEPELSPQEILLADTRRQFTTITDAYGPGLVQDLTLDSDSSIATLTLSGAWYELSPKQQDGLAQKIWQEQQRLEFNQLVIKDSSGRVIVRPPVIGDNAVIVHRVARVP